MGRFLQVSLIVNLRYKSKWYADNRFNYPIIFAIMVTMPHPKVDIEIFEFIISSEIEAMLLLTPIIEMIDWT
jgi:hypothetical protein